MNCIKWDDVEVATTSFLLLLVNCVRFDCDGFTIEFNLHGLISRVIGEDLVAAAAGPDSIEFAIDAS